MGKLVELDDRNLYLTGHTKKIKDTMIKMKDDFMYVSFLLWEIREYKYFECRFDNIYDYSEVDLGIGKTQTKQYLRICEEYSEKTSSGSPTMRLSKKFIDFNISQLIEMLAIPIVQRSDVRPEITVKEIRELKKEVKENKKTISKPSEIFEKLEIIIHHEENELRCDNCGETYLIDSNNKKQWITIADRKVCHCCFKPYWDIDLLKKEKGDK